MNILIISDDKVGYSLADHLSKTETVTIIDRRTEKFKRVMESADIKCIKGNGISAKTLLEAGVRESDLLIAATANDEKNMVSCLTAKKLGAKHTIARIMDTDYADELSQLQNDLGLDAVINPEQSTALEIERILEFPPSVKVRTLAQGRARMLEIPISNSMPICGMPLKEVTALLKKNLPWKSVILIGAVISGDGGGAIIPKGDTVLRPGDIITAVGKPANMFAFCEYLKLPVMKMKNVIIVGGGNTAYYLAKSLEKIRASITVVEMKPERCRELSEILPEALILNEDGSDMQNLTEINVGKCDGFISLTEFDEENLITSILAHRAGASKCIAKMKRQFYRELAGELIRAGGKSNSETDGRDTITTVSPLEVTAEYILEYVRGIKNAEFHPGKTLYSIVGGNLEAIEFEIMDDCLILNREIKNMKVSPSVLVAVIIRKNKVLIPHGNDEFRIGDSVIVFSNGKKLDRIEDITEDL